MMQHIFIMNPNAGRRKEQAKLKVAIDTACQEARVSYEIYESKCQNDGMAQMVRVVETLEATGDTQTKLRFYFCGGDGSVLEAANGFFALPESYRKGRVSVGVIPIGTGNDFIRNFGKAEDFLNIKAQLNGTPVLVDAIAFNNRYAANMLNIGFDCQVVKKVNELRGHFLMQKGLAYPVGVALTLIRHPHTSLKLTFDDGTTYEGRFLLSFVANGCYCGGGFKSASKAKQDDGLLDVMMIKPISRLRFLTLVGRYKKGTLLGTPVADKFIVYKQCKSVTVEAAEHADVCIDGEVEPFGKLQIQAQQQVFYFSVPNQAASVIKGSLA